MPKFLTLKKANCKNCYKCIRYCPVKAIRFSGNQAFINIDECILCGQCYAICPQNAKEIVSEIEKVKVLMQTGDPVVVSLAPSFAAAFEGIGIRGMRAALKKIGFYDVEETAIGATVVKNEYERMLREEARDIVISSCCHSVNLLIQRYYPEALEYLADYASPMQAHCADIKKRVPNAKTVFIGPCIAKKDEAEQYGDLVDAVLTFEELGKWLQEENVVPQPDMDAEEKSKARIFPTTGGVLKTMKQIPGYTYMALDGVENCMAAIEDILQGKLHKCFIEMSACVGSCVNGPVMKRGEKSTPVKDFLNVARYAGKEDFEVTQPGPFELQKTITYLDRKMEQPAEYEITAILRQMGKFKPSQELNCGSCGYNTCREKAIAIFQGKAEISMCLPFLKDKAESFSDAIVNNNPDGILVLNDKLEVQQINTAARQIMNLRYASDILGDQVVRVLDPGIFMEVRRTGQNVYNRNTYLAEYKRHVEQSVIYDNDSHLIICMMRDVTEQEIARERKDSNNRQTIEVADKVIEKQMRIVQEIASLLGETAAETKIALSKLKETISDE